jgi:hypothetical protein
MTQERTSMSKIDRLVEALIEETLAMSDEEILADAGENPEAIELALRREVDAAIASQARQRLIAAKDAVAAYKSRPNAKRRPASELRNAISKVVAKRTNSDASVTLAAREGRDIPDADLQGLADDLSELGFDLDRENEPDPS